MKRTLALLLAGTLARSRICAEDITVASGNSAGQSAEVAAAGSVSAAGAGNISRPGQITITRGTREDANTIRLSLQYPPLSDWEYTDKLVIFRARNSEPWVQVPVLEHFIENCSRMRRTSRGHPWL